jgi:two-component sensor histidine kinase
MFLNRNFTIILFVACLQGTSAVGQTETLKENKFEEELHRGIQLMSSNLIAEALISVNKSLELAKTANQKVHASNVKAEFLRATSDHEQALETLWSLSNSTIESADESHQLKRLGRLAAVHQEYGKFVGINAPDSVRFYIQNALLLANKNPDKYSTEIAALYNELGLFVYRRGKTMEAREFYQISCEKYESAKDTENLVTPLSNLLELESCSGNLKVSDSLETVLINLIEGKDWYRVKTIAYNSLAIFSRVKKDDMAALRYKLEMTQNAYSDFTASNSEKMLALRQLYEHDKLESQIEAEQIKNEKNALMLVKANIKRRQLYYYLIAAAVIGFVVVLLFFRERRIKRKMNQMNAALNQANERYQLLVQESNHRIKNNLQMITAMLEYTTKDINPSNKKVLNSIFSKINTISSLHKHLYVDIHNEFIPITNYFKEITKLYEGISPDKFNVVIDAENVEIRSERIVYFGLIFNEMLSNTLEHSPETIDQIHLQILPLKNGYHFIYEDASTHSNLEKEGTGSKLIRNLILRVGGKDFNLDTKTGRYEFEFDKGK